MSECPFTLPLSPDEFTSALHKGKGRAVMHAQMYGIKAVEAAYIDALLHDRSYDRQCEGDRVPWLMRMLSDGEEVSVARKVIAQLDQPSDRFSDEEQRAEVAKAFAERGFEDARQQLYRCLRKDPDSCTAIGFSPIIELDGAAGLVRVAEFLGQLLQDSPEFWADDWPIRFFDSSAGQGSGRRLLEAAAGASPQIGAYLAHLDARQSRVQKVAAAKPPRPSVEEIIRQIETEDPQKNRFVTLRWGRTATSAELTAILEALLKQDDAGRLCKYLATFQHQPPPFDLRLLDYARHPHAHVRWRANRALSHYAHPAVRERALELLRQDKNYDGELELLQASYQPGDTTFIEPLLRRALDRDRLHSLVLDLTKLFAAYPLAEAATPLEFAYERSPCSLCRSSAMRTLAKIHAVPDWMIDEARFDCHERTRKLAEQYYMATS